MCKNPNDSNIAFESFRECSSVEGLLPFKNISPLYLQTLKKTRDDDQPYICVWWGCNPVLVTTKPFCITFISFLFFYRIFIRKGDILYIWENIFCEDAHYALPRAELTYVLHSKKFNFYDFCSGIFCCTTDMDWYQIFKTLQETLIFCIFFPTHLCVGRKARVCQCHLAGSSMSLFMGKTILGWSYAMNIKKHEGRTSISVSLSMLFAIQDRRSWNALKLLAYGVWTDITPLTGKDDEIRFAADSLLSPASGIQCQSGAGGPVQWCCYRMISSCFLPKHMRRTLGNHEATEARQHAIRILDQLGVDDSLKAKLLVIKLEF